MSFSSKLKKVGSIDEAQLLFEEEIKRLGTLDVYRNSEMRYKNRIEKVQNDIYKHLHQMRINGVLILYDDLLISDFVYDIDNGGDKLTDLERDKRFFKMLYFGIFVWFICLYSIAFFMNKNDFNSNTDGVNVESNVVQNKPINEVTTESVLNDDELVWNKYRGSYTSVEILNGDEQWANQ